jgi:hypothetical protein
MTVFCWFGQCRFWSDDTVRVRAAQESYEYVIINGLSGQYDVHYYTLNGDKYLTQVIYNKPLQTIINDIRVHAAGTDIKILFGDNYYGLLDVGINSITFENNGSSTWGVITLKGSLQTKGTIYIGSGVNVRSEADITSTGHLAINLYFGCLTITGGNLDFAGEILATAGALAVTSGFTPGSQVFGLGILDPSVNAVAVSGGTGYSENFILGGTPGFVLYDDGTDLVLRAPERTKVSLPTIDCNSFTYNGTPQGPNVTYDSVLCGISGNISATITGVYYIEFELNDPANFMWKNGTDENVTLEWNIGKATINVTASVASKVYGEEDPEILHYTYEGFCGDDQGVFEGCLSRVGGENVGNYAIILNSLSISTDSNYMINFTGANFTITKAKAASALAPVIVSDVTATGKQGDNLSEWILSGDWAWDNLNIVPAESGEFIAYLDVTDFEINYDFTGIDGYDSDTHKIIRKINITVPATDGGTVDDDKNTDFTWFIIGGVAAVCLLASVITIPLMRKKKIVIED